MSDDYCVDYKALNEEFKPIQADLFNNWICPEHKRRGAGCAILCRRYDIERSRLYNELKKKYTFKSLDEAVKSKPNPYLYLPHIAKHLVAPEGYEYGWKTFRSREDLNALYTHGWHPVGYLDPKWEIRKDMDGYYTSGCALLCERIKIEPLESFSKEELIDEIRERLLEASIKEARQFAKEMWKEYGKRDLTHPYRCHCVERRVHKKYPHLKCSVRYDDDIPYGEHVLADICITPRKKRKPTVEEMLPALQADSVMGAGVTRADHELAWKAAMDRIVDISDRAESLEPWEKTIWKPIMESMDANIAAIERLEKLGFKVTHERD